MAGLAAALWLARYNRRVRVYDAGPARNESAWAVHGYPGLRDPAPAELLGTLRTQALEAGAELVEAEVVHASGELDSFTLTTGDGATARARRLVLAYGIRDYLPDVPGLREHYGLSVFHCPDCDGPSATGLRIGVIGADRHAARLALYLLTWTDRITLLTRGRPLRLPRNGREVLERHGIDIVSDEITRVAGSGPRLSGLVTRSGEVEVDAVFFHLGSEPRCNLARQLGCRTDRQGYARVDAGQQTSVKGVHAAGDITGHPHLAVIAASEGIRAAMSIHRSLLPQERKV